MLPNRMQLPRQTEEQLKRLKIHTGLTPNVSARIAFFRSVENGFRYSKQQDYKKFDGVLVLDKITWLGDTRQATEITLMMLYPKLDSKNMMIAWASHVEDGLSSIRNLKGMRELSLAL